MRRRPVLPLAALVAMLGFAPVLRAQTTITLEGVVVNDADKPDENAQVTAVDSARNETRSALTRANGRFRFHGLTSSHYADIARYIGFRPPTDQVTLLL